MVDVGETVTAAVVAPVLQEYEVPPEAVNIAEAPVQMIPSLLAVPELSDTETDGVGSGFTVITCEIMAEQPFSLVTVTVYVVVVVGDTVMTAVVAPVLQE